MQLLHIDSSILGSHSVSRTLTKEIVETQARLHPGLKVIYRDLAADPLQHLTGLHLAALKGEPIELPANLQSDVTNGKEALEELLASDIVVIGAPMYNFSISSQLKAWIDRITVAVKTFNYSSQGPVGLLGDKKIIIAVSRGGVYGGESPMAIYDHQETYLRALFQSFLAVKEFTIIRAEGLAVSNMRQNSLEKAHAEIAQLV